MIFGGDFTGAATEVGGDGADKLGGTSDADVLIGGRGDDELEGNGGADVLKGGADDDVLAISDLAFRLLEGNSGVDTVRFDGSGMDLDLTSVPNLTITGVEQFDLTGSGDNSLTLNLGDVLALSDTTNEVVVFGDAGDEVTVADGPWSADGVRDVDGTDFNVFTLDAGTLIVAPDVTVNGIL